jgi:hypothetical protein
MGNNVVQVFGLLFFVAIVAVLVSQRATTARVIQAIGSATGGVIGAAVSPLGQGGGGLGGGGAVSMPEDYYSRGR